MTESSNTRPIELLEVLLPQDGRWLLDISKIVLDAALAILLLIYLPYMAVALMTIWLFSFLKTPRQRALTVIPGVWGSILLVLNAAEVAFVPSFLGMRHLTNMVINGFKEQLCSGEQSLN